MPTRGMLDGPVAPVASRQGQTSSNRGTGLPALRYRKVHIAADRRVVRLIVGGHVGSSVGRSRRIQRRLPVEQVVERQRQVQVRPGIATLASVVTQGGIQ